MDVHAIDRAGRGSAQGAGRRRRGPNRPPSYNFKRIPPFPRTFFNDAGSSNVAAAVAHAHSASRVRNQDDAARSRANRVAAWRCEWGGGGGIQGHGRARGSILDACRYENNAIACTRRGERPGTVVAGCARALKPRDTHKKTRTATTDGSRSIVQGGGGWRARRVCRARERWGLRHDESRTRSQRPPVICVLHPKNGRQEFGGRAPTLKSHPRPFATAPPPTGPPPRARPWEPTHVRVPPRVAAPWPEDARGPEIGAGARLCPPRRF